MKTPVRIHVPTTREDNLPNYVFETIDFAARVDRKLESDLLRFADRFKTRRIYCVQWHEDKNFCINFYYKFFKYEDRATAYSMARYYKVGVQIYDFKKLIDISPIYKATFPFRFSREAAELWKTFNTCVLCKTERQCFDVLFRGEKARMCESCIGKFELFPVKTGIKRRKDDSSRR